MKTHPYIPVEDLIKAGELAIDALIEHDRVEAGIIPVGKHIGYFILMDENGNPIKQEDIPPMYKDLRDIPEHIVIEPTPVSEDLQKLQMVDRALRNTQPFNKINVVDIKGV